MKISSGQEYAAKIINTKKLSARGTSPFLFWTLLSGVRQVVVKTNDSSTADGASSVAKRDKVLM